MVILITGETHTGKTAIAHNLMKKYNIPYICLDHLKMGLIRSKNTSLTPNDDKKLKKYLWNITKEIIKTAVENKQNLIIEGCYIPFKWKEYFSNKYLKNIKYYCLIMTKDYINNNFENIIKYENIIEKRYKKYNLNKDELIKNNEKNLKKCIKHNLDYILIKDSYNIDISL